MLAPNDVRLLFLHSFISSVFGENNGSEGTLLQKLQETKQVEKFLEEEDCLVLEICELQNGEFHIGNELSFKTHRKHIFFLKSHPTIHITKDTVQVGSLDKPNSAQQLLYLIHLIYKPLLQAMDSNKQSDTIKRLQDMLNELQLGLQSYLKLKSSTSRSQAHREKNDFFLTPQEEMRQYEYFDDAQSIRLNEIFQESEVYESFEKLNEKEIDELLKSNFIDNVKNMLDMLWDMDPEPYSESRMHHLLSVMASELDRYIYIKLSNLKVWEDPFSQIKKQYTNAIDLCDEWTKMTEELTTVDWIQDPTHRWYGPKHVDSNLLRLSNRMEHILQLRNSYEEVKQNLTQSTSSEGEDSSLQEVTTIFHGIDMLDLSNMHSEKQYKIAIQAFENLLIPLEKQISEKLKIRLQQYMTKPQLLIYEFQRHKGLIQRRNIRLELSQERTTLLGQIRSHVNTLKSRFEMIQFEDFKSNPKNEHVVGRTVSKTINAILIAKNIEQQVRTMKTALDTFLNDLVEKSLINDLETFLDNLKVFCNKNYNAWREKMEFEGDFTLIGKPMISMVNAEGQSFKQLKVNYTDEHILLMRDVRQLSSLGYSVPQVLRKAASEIEQLYTQAVTLKQIAVYYNTVHTQIIDSHSQMLMKPAAYFEKVIFEFEKLRKMWSPEKGSSDISELQKAAKLFSSEHQKLKTYHRLVGEKVVELLNISLVNETARWEECFADIRKIFATVEGQGYQGTELWRNHWDYQLYKALEHQYQVGLETLNSVSWSGMNIDIVFKQGRLHFVPPLEDIKDRYYRKLREFISIPIKFQGVGKTDIYKFMVHDNHTLLKNIYHKSSKLFAKLEKFLEAFEKKLVLGNVPDLEQLLTENLTDVSQWEVNFRTLKQKGKDMERIPTNQKIDCFNISTQRIKSLIGDQLQRFGDTLVKTLRESGERHLNNVNTFIEASREKLERDPSSIAEIGEANEFCQQLNAEKHTILLEFQEFEKKNRLLRGVAGTGIEAATVKAKWQNFDDTLSAHDKYLLEKTSALRQKVDDKVNDFKNRLARFAAHWHEFKPRNLQFVSEKQTLEEVTFIQKKQEEFLSLESESEEIIKECQYFGLKQQNLNDLDVGEDISKMNAIWKTYQDYINELKTFTNENWIIFKKERKGDSFDDFITTWLNKLKSLEMNAITMQIRKDLDVYIQLKDYISFLYGDGWTVDHWAYLFSILGIVGKTNDTLTFGDFVAKATIIVEKIDLIKELNARALGEEVLRKSLEELKVWASATHFNIYEHEQSLSRGTMKTPLIKDWKEIRTAVGDNQSLIQSLKDSKFIDMFAVEVKAWELNLQTLDEYLDQLNKIQLKWIYLSPIFHRGALPSHQSLFLKLDSSFRLIMNDIRSDTRVIQLAKRPIKNNLKVIFDQLQVCQKALNQFLEEKRSTFPRFYFIGDDDLLQILGQSQNPEIIQIHLKKLFQGIHSVKFNADNTQIIAMCSSAGEEVKLLAPVTVTEKVEDWLGELDSEMKHTLEALLGKCLSATDFNIDSFPSQILCLSELINFTRQCEEAIAANSLPSFLKSLRNTLADYTTIETKDNYLQELKIKALILDIIHNIQVVEELLKSKINLTSDWMWQKQLRFYKDDNKKCVVRMCNAEFLYTYEYQGNVPKLVHTPLTDKCYLTLTQGMHLGYGGNPYGPAGTGKTESVKALGSLLGRQVLVFNCDEGIDFQSMGRIFIGLVKCGAWGCFDEFNRLKEDQLSAISQQIQVIQNAIKEKKDTAVDLLDTKVLVNPNAGIFVTLNPAGKKYGGRSKLPDNLKQLFRSVAMSVPDLDLIAEVILYSEGFIHAEYLGKKLVALYQLCKQLLSPQQHYDWGLRAMKTVLSIGGSLIKREKSERQLKELSKEIESEIIIKSIRVNTISKLTYHDTILFRGIIDDVFPGIATKDIEYEAVENAIRSVLKDWNLVAIDSQIQKILQFYEACNQRMGVVICGDSGCGKTTVWKVLQEAFSRMKLAMKVYVVNPKSIPRQQLLGSMDPDTREWSEGILTSNARQVIQEPQYVRSWIVCDGDIDPEWVESLNSVLDDNHLLTMPTGERIKFGDNVNFVFETHSLKFASPATVSRMGMIFLSEQDVGVKALVASWIAEQPEAIRSAISNWIEAHFYIALEEAKKLVHAEITSIGLVRTTLSQLVGCSTKGQFVIGLVRGLGCYIHIEKRSEFANLIFKTCQERPIDIQNPLNCKFSHETSQYVPYSTDISEELSFESILNHPMVKTIDVQRNMDIILPWIEKCEPFILVGPEGAGKSMLLHNAFKSIRGLQVAVVHCNAQTNASNIISKLEQSCNFLTSKDGKVLRPKDGDRLALYIKDINLPKPDQYGTSQAVSFLQQILTYKGYYNSELEFITLEGVQIVASMNPSSTVGRYPLTTRFTSLVHQCHIYYPSSMELETIFYVFAKVIFKKLFPSHPIWSNPANQILVVKAMLELYEKVQNKFSRTTRSHYMFTPRDLQRWILGVMKYEYEDESAVSFLNALFYEARRLFCDLLVDQSSYDSIERGVMRHFDKFSFDADISKLVYSCLASTDTKKGRMAIVKLADYASMIKDGLKRFDREHRKLRILFMSEIVTYIAQIERVLSQDRGSLLLIGESGIGRSNFVQLVAHMLNIELISPKVTLRYSLKQYKADLKQVCTIAGLEGRPVCFFLEDHQILDHSYMEYINSLLCSGEVSGIFTQEELEPLLAQLRETAAKDIEFEGGNLNAYFMYRIKKNLRIALSMNPTNKNFEIYCQSNPAIFNECTILWKTNWTKSGYGSVPKLVLGTPILSKISIPVNELITHFVRIHDSLLPLGVTPLHFLRFLDGFKKIFVNKLNNTITEQNRLKKGLSKLNEASSTVDQLKVDANEKKKLLTIKQEETEKNMKLIEQNMSLAVKQKDQIQEVQAKINIEESKLKDKQDVINGKLSKVKPILDSAKKAVGELSSQSLGYIRSLPNPPKPVEHVLKAVLTYMGSTQIDWNSMKKFLGSRGVVQSILSFDARSVSKSVVDRVRQVIHEHRESFEDDNISRVSKEAAALAKWVVANIEYTEILKTVAPLEEELRELRQIGDRYREQLAKYDAALNKLNSKTKALQDEFENNTAEAAQLQVALEEAERTLHAAETLLGKLSSERVRWESQVRDANGNIEDLPRYVLIAAAFITCLGGKPEDVRKTYIDMWKEQLQLQEFDLKEFMSTESEMLQYKMQGLPADTLSQENSIIMLNSEFPLIVDPAQQATRWLLKRMEEGKVEITNTHDEKFNNTLELSVRFGKVLIIQEIDNITPVLFPILRKELYVNGPRKSVMIGDKMVDYNDDFKLFLVTRSADIALSPDSSPLISEVNFTVTKSGLEGQLLGLTIQHENPELEKQKSDLLQLEEDNKIKLADLETSLLEQLAASKGNLLEDVELLEHLNRIKVSSQQIKESLEKSSALKKTLDDQREGYRAFARSGSIIYFLMCDLRQVNPMYQFSLSSFLSLFQRALHHQDASSSEQELAVRIALLTEVLQSIVFRYLSRSLFKEDTLLFGVHLVHKLFSDTIKEDEWNYFIGNHFAQTEQAGRVPVPSWVASNRRSAYIDFVSSLPHLASTLELTNESVWATWLKSEDCKIVPQFVNKKLSAFQKLLLVQVFRPDQLINVMDAYVCQALGIATTAATPLNLQSIYTDESNAKEPILLITTPGADPSVELEELASMVVGKHRFHAIAMSQGQTDDAIQLLRQCAENGNWICLKNLHLVVSWLPDLEKEISMLKCHDGFRLWLTTEIHSNFPSILLQQSLKITFESPPGIKQNLLRTFSSWNNEFLHDSEFNPKNRSKLFYILAWFHAIVQERRSYIPQGWTKFYEFSSADIRSGADIINASIKSDYIDWKTIHGLLENAIYGGRMDNHYDIRILNAYLQKYFNNRMISNHGASLAKGVSVPSETTFDEYSKIIERLPNLDPLDYFDLPPNANRVVMINRSNKLLGCLKQLSISSSLSAELNQRGQWVDRVTPIIEFWKKTMEGKNHLLDHSCSEDAEKYLRSPLGTFIYLEHENARRLCILVNNDLMDIENCISGGIETLTIQLNVEHLLKDEIPPKWEEQWEGPSDLRKWLTQVVFKASQVSRLSTIDNYHNSGPLELHWFFNPHVFLNALKQQTARESGQPLDSLTYLASQWQGSIDSNHLNDIPCIKVTISGLLLQGCSFDGATLTSLNADSAVLQILPPCELAWITEENHAQYKRKVQYDQELGVPLYINSNREYQISELHLPCNETEKYIFSATSVFISEF